MTLKFSIIIPTIFILSLNSINIFCQNTDTTKSDYASSNIDYLKLGIALGTAATALTFSFIDQHSEYWRDNGRFHIMTLRNEYDDALMADKFGHLYITYAATKTYKYAFEWIGMDSIKAIWWSAAVALAHQTFTEIQDGFSYGGPYLGFSFGDVFANLAGAGYAVLSEYHPYLRNFNFKVSLSQKNFVNQKYHNYILQDYTSRYNWLSINVHNLLPDDLQKWYPSFVNIAAGFTVQDINRFGKGYHEFYLALDWNFEEKPDDNIIERLLKNILNLYHFPAPAVKLYPDVVWYGLLF